MKLVRYGPAGKEKPGLIDADGKLRDLSRKVKDIDRRDAGARRAREAREARPEEAAAGQGQAAPRRCVATPSKFVAIGLNYADHAKESGIADPRASGRVLQGADLHRRARTTTR